VYVLVTIYLQVPAAQCFRYCTSIFSFHTVKINVNIKVNNMLTGTSEKVQNAYI